MYRKRDCIMLNYAHMETWLSGRKRLTANEVGFKSPRRFESGRLRKFSKKSKWFHIKQDRVGRSRKLRPTRGYECRLKGWPVAGFHLFSALCARAYHSRNGTSSSFPSDGTCRWKST